MKKPSRPNKHDIRQLENFVTRGVSQIDIEDILGITSSEFERWKKNIQVDRIVKLKPKQDPERYTLNHPDLAGQTELAFEAGLIKFYRFKEEFRHPTGRYKYVYKRFKEADMRVSREILIQYLDLIEKALDGSNKKGINLSTALRNIYNLRTWTKIPFEPEAVRRLAAVVYFTDDEDLSTFDEEKGRWKEELWVKNKVHDFFLTRPIGELLNLSNTSSESLQEYLADWEPILKELTSDLLESKQATS